MKGSKIFHFYWFYFIFYFLVIKYHKHSPFPLHFSLLCQPMEKRCLQCGCPGGKSEGGEQKAVGSEQSSLQWVNWWTEIEQLPPEKSNNVHYFSKSTGRSNLYKIIRQAQECRGIHFGREQGAHQNDELSKQVRQHNRIPNIKYPMSNLSAPLEEVTCRQCWDGVSMLGTRLHYMRQIHLRGKLLMWIILLWLCGV